MSTKKTLQKAKELLSQGWCKKATHKDGFFCMLGALYTAKHNLLPPTWAAEARLGTREECEILITAIREFRPTVRSVSYINDLSETTKEDVMHYMDAAIRLAEKSPKSE